MTNISTYDVRDVAGWYQEGAGWILFGIWGHIHTALHDAEFAVELCNASTAPTVCLTALYSLQPLQRCRAIQLYSRYTLYILYTTPQALASVRRNRPKFLVCLA